MFCMKTIGRLCLAGLCAALVACSGHGEVPQELAVRGFDSGLSEGGAAPDAQIERPLDGGSFAPMDGEVQDAERPEPREAAAAGGALEPRQRTGVVLDDDSTLWCIARGTHGAGGERGALEAFLRRVPSDATSETEEPFRFDRGGVSASLTCSAREGGGERIVVTSAASRDEDDDRVLVRCPDEHPYASDGQCRIVAEAAAELRRVSMPSRTHAGDVPLSDSQRCIAGITDWQVHGQVTGFVSEYMSTDGAVVGTMPLQNEALMRTAQVGGTDEGAMFFAQGKMWLVFGDTSALDANDPLTVALQGPGLWRSNVLVYTSDLDASDGFAFDGFETVGDSAMAAERVLSPHDGSGEEGAELTAIPRSDYAPRSEISVAWNPARARRRPAAERAAPHAVRSDDERAPAARGRLARAVSCSRSSSPSTTSTTKAFASCSRRARRPTPARADGVPYDESSIYDLPVRHRLRAGDDARLQQR